MEFDEMKPEWITDNVKRAWERKAFSLSLNDSDRMTQAYRERLAAIDFQEALDLLHFATKRANVPVELYWAPIFSAKRDEG